MLTCCSPFSAEEPVTDERTLARVPPEVSLEMGCLVVDLAAARDVTRVDVALPQMFACRAWSRVGGWGGGREAGGGGLENVENIGER